MHTILAIILIPLLMLIGLAALVFAAGAIVFVLIESALAMI